ncbi:MAG: carbamoyl phosphate synthase small subunit [Oscillospiraceae bacterium]|nr:carbamoyl phosphate synthase small subunit [Oscillospiraceae bacterium]
MENTAYLLLENGRVFEGKRFGAQGDITGEIVFTTSMTGYLETLTDPNYFGQMVVQTFPLIGNYGVIPSDFESNHPHLKAYIVREWCQEPSNYRSEGNLDAFLKYNNIIGLYDIDTRELTRIIREHGVMNARIASSISDLQAEKDKLKGYKITNAVLSVGCKEMQIAQPDDSEYHVVLWDFGVKSKILKSLKSLNCRVTIVPPFSTAEQIIALKPNGITMSNGPGDPAENTGIINEIKKLCNLKMPIFGIGLGHQLLALSQGAKTTKLKYGHRGANQPTKYMKTGLIYITSQNHGYAVVADSLPKNAVLSFTNVNDGSAEGINYSDMPAFSVQFHPDAASGPLDTGFLFTRFIELMKEGC